MATKLEELGYYEIFGKMEATIHFRIERQSLTSNWQTRFDRDRDRNQVLDSMVWLPHLL
ncbi:hypothetical protein [Geitlerinema sp. PCC 9228]|uniref:hypothetical protein n=1 Tax=Geitlerinema sp. PCC 9228 TaxID=111611 RepID=UPI00147A30B1|nr:hypothetical protein [Geitlerinema sp. PCC 9228]